MILYKVFLYDDDTGGWTLHFESHSEKEAVAEHRLLQKKGLKTFIDYEEEK